MRHAAVIPIIVGCYHEAPPPLPPPATPAPVRCKREQLSTLAAERLVVDTHDLYVASYMSSITQISLSSPTETTFAVDVNIMRLAIDDSYLYWSSLSGDRSVKRRAKSGGPIEIIASHQADPEHIAIDSSAVYWTTINGNAVMKWDKTTHKTTQFATGSGALALDNTDVYWASARRDGVSGIGRKPKRGGDPSLIASDSAHMLATDGTTIYWTAAYGADIQRATPVETFSIGTAFDNNPEVHTGDISVDASHVYWEQDGVLLRRSKQGGAVEVVVPNETTVRAFALTPDAIYWTTTHGSFRMKKAPCGL